ncbi:MAG TPA: peptide chain release factor N(5)-glutamine methyltransferase [Jatrophihabitantaceae bacterium]|nr:peptide chain release factor N(5)-glutamine methyltransferase [Jatrophihabitantaceae bacterium]
MERAVAELDAAGVASPRPDAMALAASALGVERLTLAVPPPARDGFTARYRALVARRAAREPLQHILGFAWFRHVRLQVRAGVFVPRPETEVVAGAAIDEVRAITGRTPLVVDLCTGTGAIAASVADEAPAASVIAVDVDHAAVDLARTNLAAFGDRARVELADVTAPALLAALAGTVDVLVSNPPYIPPDAVPVDPEVHEHDPTRALYGGGADGLDVPRAVVAAARRLLRAGGLLVMEHGDEQGPPVRELVQSAGGFDRPQTCQDLTGRDRYVVARRV